MELCTNASYLYELLETQHKIKDTVRKVCLRTSYSKYCGNNNVDFFRTIDMFPLAKLRVITVAYVSRFCCTQLRTGLNNHGSNYNSITSVIKQYF
jgi:hypothetical protein